MWALVIGILSIVGVLFMISLADLTNRETTLLGTVLTLLSVFIGWGISHYYSIQDKKAAIEEVREFEQKNLRTYALKAAEKVTNLSKELNRLSAYLEEELQYTEYRNPEEELFAKEERIESSIHIIGSLRSINDTSLSDWQGVIGEELEEQRETEKEQAQALRELSERLTTLERSPVNLTAPLFDNSEIDEIKRQLRSLSADLTGTNFRARTRPSYQNIEAVCPSCSNPISYGQRAKENDKKAIQCKTCETNLISTFREATGFTLAQRGTTSELISCPTCSAQQMVKVDEWPTASSTTNCTSCATPLRISRADNGKTLRVATQSQQKPTEPLTPQVIEQVFDALPQQPWPKGIHQAVAEQLALRPNTVQKAIQHLIRAGKFSDQIDGVLCTTEEKLKILREEGARL